MKMRTIITTMVLFMFADEVSGQAPPVRVLASNGMKAVMEELRPNLERQVGRPLNVEFNTSAATRKRIEGGEAFDVAILTTEVIDELAKGGKVAAGTIGPLGRSGIGIGVRAGSPKFDVSTPDALKQALGRAKSLTWVEVGASRVHIERMLEALGIAQQMKAKTILTQAVDQSLERVTEGKAEIILTLLSEIVPAKGVQLIGPLPPKFQNYVSFAGAVSPNAKLPAAATLLIRQLAAPSTLQIYQKNGMELTTQDGLTHV
jgi:molybdate transport system substrate-binding protein